MMLQALVAYAERENLGDPDFEKVNVRWLISLDATGNLVGGLIPLAENPDDRKPKPKPMLRPFTSPNELNQGDKSHFLCDTLERSTLMLDVKAASKADARRIQHAYFKALLREAASVCPTEADRLGAVISFLENSDAIRSLHAQLAVEKAKPSDNATFSVDGVNLLESEPLKQFWRDRRARAAAGTARTRRVCIATGTLAETLDTTEKIKGVPGGLATGTNLISFDKDAFCSFGLEQAQNAALSAEAELKIRSALNTLIEESRAQKLVFNDTICLHWTRQPLDFDPVDVLASADPNAVARLLHSVREGCQVTGMDTNAYYAVNLSGNGARIVVRDWLESTVPEVEQHVARWFIELGIVEPGGVNVKREFSLGQLLWALANPKLKEPFDALPHGASEGLLRAALTGGPVPGAILMAALRREIVDRVSGGDKAGQRKPFLPSRFALIKLCLLRSTTRKEEHHVMSECLNPDSRDPAYLCGRLFAVIDRLQYLALGSVNAGVVERFYASASSTPSLVMGRLFRNAQFHLDKVGARWGGGTAENVRRDFEEITCALGDAFPPSLTLEQQGRFALGYYHQKADYRRRSAERQEAEAKADTDN